MSKVLVALIACASLIGVSPESRAANENEGELVLDYLTDEMAFQLRMVERACSGCTFEELQAALQRELEFYENDDRFDPLATQVSRRVVASWYGGGEKLNKHTANGDVFNPNALTAAMRSCPFGTMVKVTNPRNGKSVVVRINDRGPAKKTGASIDLSRKAARIIGINKGPVIISKC